MNYKIYPYNIASKSAKVLSTALECRRVYPDRNYEPRGEVIINWGSGRTPNWFEQAWATDSKILNSPRAVSRAGNKLLAFRDMKEARTVQWTTEQEQADLWVQQGYKVIARDQLRGHSGAGIRTYDQHSDPAPLYTKYLGLREEYRVHVFKGNVICVQQKRRSRTQQDEDVNWTVRNTKGGFVYCVNDVQELSEDSIRQCVLAVQELNLDFGAVDLAVTRNEHVGHVLEVNTAPGLESPTVIEAYIKAFKGE